MTSPAVGIQRVIVYEGPEALPFEAAVRADLLQTLLGRGYAASLRRAGGRLVDLGHESIVVLGRFAGSIPDWMQRGVEGIDMHVHDIADRTIDEAVGLVEQSCQETGRGTANGWKPWFPVIDYDRCTNCMQCLSFCLFDVYGVTPGGKITVQNESNCKTDCPACSRVCPDVAILFPKYKAGPINGDEVNSDDVRREAMKVDISALLGGDIYAMLRDRSAKAKSRFSKERDDERALKERQRCLKKLKEDADLDIPADVLASLPSLDQIQQKAAEAKARADAAIKQNQANAAAQIDA
ncbi:MAG: ferredoxin family protein [Planctomycetaceae bacterium]|nr:ferredoxin family protein [Planctomycetaceae bacterium]